MVDTRSSTDVLYFDAFQKFGLTEESLTPMALALTEFTSNSISPIDTTTLPITMCVGGGWSRSKTIMVTFMVASLPSTYNVILNHPTLNKLRVVVYTYHWAIKFLTWSGIEEVRSDPRESRRRYLTIIMLPKKLKLELPLIDPRYVVEVPPHPKPTKQTLEVPLDKSRLDKVMKIGSALLRGD